ncbi:MAG TPA: hypothetical protein VFP65_29095 [Anaeromyxobacteraceae bacterium]|nr:hypothetical protein [Anaeromyxobacteraceae bacterium]
MKSLARPAVLLAALAALAPPPARGAERSSPAASCKREQDLCRQMYSCRIQVGPETVAAEEPYYCRKCQKKLDDCLAIAGLQRTVRHAPPRKKRGEVGTRMAGHELKDPKFGSGLAKPDPKRGLGGVEIEEPDATAKSGPRAEERRRKRPGADSSS